MPENKLLNGRITHKHDTPRNWGKATNFIPKNGELIIYDYDKYRKMKIGDGVTNVNLLPFVETSIVNVLTSSENLKIGDGTNGKNTKISLSEDGEISYDTSNHHLSTPSEDVIRLNENTSITLSDFSVYALTSDGVHDINYVYADIFCTCDGYTFSKVTLSSSNSEFKPATPCIAVVCVYTKERKTTVTQAGNQVEVTVYPADADTLYNDIEIVVKHYEQHNISDHIANEENPHKVIGSQLEDYDDFVLKNKIYEANTENVVEVIRNAQAGSTIQLTPGNYGLLTLHVTMSTTSPGKSTIYTKPFADNITIKGTEGAVVAGIDISGCYKVTNHSAQIDEGSELSKNLSIEDLELAGSLCIGNCIFDGLSIKRCHLTNGGITVTPNSFVNSYHDRVSGQTENKFLFQSTRGKNLSIRHCTIDNYDEFYNSAIYVHTCDDIEIYQNTVTDGGSNAITVRGYSVTTATTAPDPNDKSPTTSACKGKIAIHNNSIYNASNYGVYVTELQDASVQVLRNNFYYGDGTGTYVRILNYENSYITTRRMNANSSNGFHNLYKYKKEGATKYTDVYLLPNNGISISGDFSYARKSELTTLTDTVSSNKTSLANSIGTVKNSLTSSINAVDEKLDNYMAYNISVSTADDILSVIKNARPGATITLAAGTYPTLKLTGKDAFKDNITIVGTKDVIIDGVSITSGQCPFYDVQEEVNCDISNARLSSNITFSGITFTKSFCVRNSEIDGVKVVGCTFKKGANFNITPNSFSDSLGDDNPFATTTLDAAPYYATRVAYNVVVKDCTFEDANTKTDGTYDTRTAIYIKGVDGAAINNNTILGAGHNGIQFDQNNTANKSYAPNTGYIRITNNKISGTGSRSIRMNGLVNATVYMLYNQLSDSDKNPAVNSKGERVEDNKGEKVKINCDYTTEIITNYQSKTSSPIVETNTFDGTPLEIGSADGSPLLISRSSTSRDYGINSLLNRIKELEATVNSLISHGTDEPDSSITTTYYIKHE